MFQPQTDKNCRSSLTGLEIRFLERHQLPNFPCGDQNTEFHGQKHLTQLGINLTANKISGKKILHITDNTIETKTIKWILKKYPKLCTRIKKSKNHITKPTMIENFTFIQQKGGRVSLNLLEKENKLKKLIEEKQIIKLDKCSDEYFISPVVITFEQEKSVKIALDSKKLNDAKHKNKYQMQSIEHLIETCEETSTESPQANQYNLR